jgi:CheY-like chemotaxis protein
VVKKLRSLDQYQEIPILAMISNVFVVERESLLKVGFDDLLIKPLQEIALVETIGSYSLDTILNKTKYINCLTEFEESHEFTDLRRFCMDKE